MKIQIIGYSGSGKSTFTNQLSTMYNIESFHLDQYFFNPNWVEVEKELFIKSIDNILNKKNG